MAIQFLNAQTVAGQLTVVNQIGGDESLIVTPATGSFSIGDIQELGNGATITGDADKIQILNTGNVTLTATTNNEVTIGSSPNGIDANKLEVYEARTNSTSSTSYTLESKASQDNTVTGTPGTGGIKVAYSSDGGSTYPHGFGLVAGSSSADFLTTGPMHFYTNSDLDTHSATGFAMMIDTSQRVTIGDTVSDGSKLLVSGGKITVKQSSPEILLKSTSSASQSSSKIVASTGSGSVSPPNGQILWKGLGQAGGAGLYLTTYQTTGSYPTSEIFIPQGTANGNFYIKLNNSNALEINPSTPQVKFNAYGIGTFSGTVSKNLAVDVNGNVIETDGSVIDGSGTTNYVAKWSDANTLTDSQIFDNGTNVGVGTGQPTCLLDVTNGELNVAGGDGYRIEEKPFATFGSDLLTLGDWDGEGYSTRIMGNDSSEVMRITDKVGIGTNVPGATLEVKGDSSNTEPAFKVTETGDRLFEVGPDNATAFLLGDLDALGDEPYIKGTYSHIEIYANGDLTATFDDNNRVGIGSVFATRGPETTLEVAKNDQTNGATISITNAFNGGGWNEGDILGSIDFRTDDSSTTQPVRGRIECIDAGSNNNTYPFKNALTFGVGHYNNAMSEVMRIENNGVGILNNNPQRALEVNGELNVEGGDGYFIEEQPFIYYSSSQVDIGDWDGQGFKTSLMFDGDSVLTVGDLQTSDLIVTLNQFPATVESSSGSTLNPITTDKASADTLGTLCVDPNGVIVRGEQEATWTFTRAQLNGSLGITLLNAPGANKAVIVTESDWMIKYNATGNISTNQNFEIRQASNTAPNAIISVLPGLRINEILSASQGTPANPSYGFCTRDVPLQTRTYKTNTATTLHKLTGDQLPSGVISISIKLKYRVFDGTTF